MSKAGSSRGGSGARRAAPTSPRAKKPERSSDASGTPVRRPRDRERTIETILDAAERLLEKKGPDGFGLAELGREADISFGLIHHYFGGKEGLLKAVLRRTLRGMGREIRNIQDDGSFWRRDAPAVLVVFDTFTNSPAIGRLVAWGLLTGLIGPDDLSSEFSVDAEAVGEMVEAFRRQSPEGTGDYAAITATLLISAVLGFNLLRPLLSSSFEWGPDEDAQVRAQLARAMVGLASEAE